MTARELTFLLGLLAPHLVAVGLCAARLLPVAFLCPVLGGQAAPSTVKLGLVLSLSLSLHLAGGVGVPGGLDAWGFAALAGRELAFGSAIGLVAALPFDAARIGGRLIDLFRGTGARESASGDCLYQLLVARVASGGALPAVISNLWRSFGVVPPGSFVATEAAGLHVAAQVGVALATGLAVGAPIAASSLGVELLLGLASRASPPICPRAEAASLRTAPATCSGR